MAAVGGSEGRGSGARGGGVGLALDLLVHLEEVLAPVAEGRREEVREEPLDEREHRGGARRGDRGGGGGRGAREADWSRVPGTGKTPMVDAQVCHGKGRLNAFYPNTAVDRENVTLGCLPMAAGGRTDLQSEETVEGSVGPPERRAIECRNG